VKNEQGLWGAKRLLTIQLIVILVTARFADVTLGLEAAFSVILGGIIHVLPSMSFAWIMFKPFKTPHIKHYMKRVYRGEAFKIGLTLFLFTLTFCCIKQIVPWVLLTSFLIVQGTVWITPWIFVKRECDK
jgi:ATP synthase protein I